MAAEIVSATTLIPSPPRTVFAVLADPNRHAAIDGTGWVRESLDGEQLTATGQIFRIAMYHDNHPDGSYEMANRVQAFDPPNAISWEPGQDAAGTGTLEFGGWIWRYDLVENGSGRTQVTLSYDWSAVPPFLREHIAFPPFAADHLENSLRHLGELAAAADSRP